MPETSREGTVIDDWFTRRTIAADQRPDPAALAARKGDLRIAAVLPARDEEATVGAIVEALATGLRDRWHLVDEVVVVDSHSSDETAKVAGDAGATVVACRAHPEDGKGGAIRSGLAASDADIVVFLDADVDSFHDGYVTGLIAPLIDDPRLVLAKAFYDRPFRPSAARENPAPSVGQARANGGGRVTELVARPAIAASAPELSGFAQPLAGEYAVRRAPVARLPLVSGYGVDLGLLLSIWQQHGLDAMCQVDLGHRSHRHQGLDALGRMAVQVRAAVRLVLDSRTEIVSHHTRFVRDDADRLVREVDEVTTRMLPPLS